MSDVFVFFKGGYCVLKQTRTRHFFWQEFDDSGRQVAKFTFATRQQALDTMSQVARERGVDVGEVR